MTFPAPDDGHRVRGRARHRRRRAELSRYAIHARPAAAATTMAPKRQGSGAGTLQRPVPRHRRKKAVPALDPYRRCCRPVAILLSGTSVFRSRHSSRSALYAKTDCAVPVNCRLDGEARAAPPIADGPDAPAQVVGDLFPAVQPAAARGIGGLAHVRGSCASRHHSAGDDRMPDELPIRTTPGAPSAGRRRTAGSCRRVWVLLQETAGSPP